MNASEIIQLAEKSLIKDRKFVEEGEDKIQLCNNLLMVWLKTIVHSHLKYHASEDEIKFCISLIDNLK